jgi:lipid A ethanolaminephosphotransferase
MILIKLIALAAIGILGRGYLASDWVVLAKAARKLAKRRKNRRRRRLLVASYAATAVALLAAPFVESTALRTIMVLYLALNATVLVLYRNITGFYLHQRAIFDEEISEVLWREKDMAVEAFRAYRREVLTVVVPAVALIAILVWPPAPPLLIPGLWGLAPLAALAGIVLAYVAGWEPPLPVIATLPARIVRHVRAHGLVTPCPAAPVTLPFAGRTLDKLVFVMDESVRGDCIDPTSPVLGTTPFLSRFGAGLVDFGIALSGHNCSSYSRYLLRHGARVGQLPEAVVGGLNLAGPNLYQYAKAAGFRTVYVDGFSSELRLHSGMTLQEAGFIDSYRTIPKVPAAERDVHVGRLLLDALAEPGPAFIYVDKFGIHAPYEDKIPPAYATETAPAGASPRAAMVASYRNALRWGVDAFFERILGGIDFARTALFYTSDHGQSLLDRDYKRTHCSVGPDIADGEAMVPLFVITGETALHAALAEAAPRMTDRATHYEIFPTVLIALGYERRAVEAAYGAGLLGAPSGWRRFLTGYKSSTAWAEVSAAPRARSGGPAPADAADPATPPRSRNSASMGVGAGRA